MRHCSRTSRRTLFSCAAQLEVWPPTRSIACPCLSVGSDLRCYHPRYGLCRERPACPREVSCLGEGAGNIPQRTALAVGRISMEPLGQTHHVRINFPVALATLNLHTDGPVFLGGLGEGDPLAV